ncbi:MAG: hypothetical protein QOG34_1954 [Frankiaceae bacterium]|jgi:hypothetical protein|nr:hypothetical protein [Frankiaceae bacterium]
MVRSKRKVLLGVLAVGLASAVMPAASPASASSLPVGCASPDILSGGWFADCQFTASAGTGTLTLTIYSGAGFASVTCTSGGHAELVENNSGTFSTTYTRSGTCELVAGGTGSGNASAT